MSVFDNSPDQAWNSDQKSEYETQIQYRLIEKLSESEERYRSLFNSIPLPVFECDNVGKLLLVNAAWREMFRVNTEDDQHTHLQNFFVGDDQVAVAACLPLLTKSGTGQPFSLELQVRDADHATLHVVLTIHAASSEVRVGSLYNISKQKETELSLRLARDAAEQANELKSCFLAHMSHEIRTPLSVLLGYAEKLSEAHLDEPTKTALKAGMTRNSQQLLSLLQDIIDFSKIEKNLLETAEVPVHLGSFIKELEIDQRQLFSGKQIAFEICWDNSDDQGCYIFMDPFRVKQILANLLSNAAKFTTYGAVTLLIALDRKLASLSLAVTDTGIGISEQDVGTIFEPFRQVNQSFSRTYGGAGLGLAIASRLASLLGGRLSAESKLGEGSTFTLEIPLRLADEARATALEHFKEREIEPTVSSPLLLRTLVAEDNPDLSFLMLQYLNELGFSADTASTGQEVIKVVRAANNRQEPYEMILMDMQMPEMDGYTATRELRNTGFRGLIIAVTAHALSSDRAKCFECGCDEYLTKPYSLEMLSKIIEKVKNKTA